MEIYLKISLEKINYALRCTILNVCDYLPIHSLHLYDSSIVLCSMAIKKHFHSHSVTRRILNPLPLQPHHQNRTTGLLLLLLELLLPEVGSDQIEAQHEIGEHLERQTEQDVDDFQLVVSHLVCFRCGRTSCTLQTFRGWSIFSGDWRRARAIRVLYLTELSVDESQKCVTVLVLTRSRVTTDPLGMPGLNCRAVKGKSRDQVVTAPVVVISYCEISFVVRCSAFCSGRCSQFFL